MTVGLYLLLSPNRMKSKPIKDINCALNYKKIAKNWEKFNWEKDFINTKIWTMIENHWIILKGMPKNVPPSKESAFIKRPAAEVKQNFLCICVLGSQEKKQKTLNFNTCKLEVRFWRKIIKREAGHKENYDKQSWGKLPVEEYFLVFWGFYFSISRIKNTKNDRRPAQD